MRRPKDPLEIPKPLRRPLTAASRARVDSVLRQESVHHWVMPDPSRYALTAKAVDLYDEPSTQETDVAKYISTTEGSTEGLTKKAKAAKKKSTKKGKIIGKAKTGPVANGGASIIDCSDPKLPVEVNLTLDTGKTETMKFENIQEFIDWFDPKTHDLEGSIADEALTMISVQEKLRPKADPRTGKKGVDNSPGGAIPQPEKTTTRGAMVKKGPVGPRGETPSREKKPRGVNFVRHGVKVGGKDYTSAWQAFQQLNLGGAAECVKFRTLLKASKNGEATFEKGGKKYKFELVELK